MMKLLVYMSLCGGVGYSQDYVRLGSALGVSFISFSSLKLAGTMNS